MEWNRGNQPTAAAPGPGMHNAPGRKKRVTESSWLRYVFVGLLFSATLLVIAITAYLSVGKSSKSSEASEVKSGQMQAVFLNGGQVYFGKIDDVDSRNMKLSNIYYLRVNQQVQPNQQSTQTQQNDISLVKLGCELHGPEDSMVINREHIIFWENLKTDGQVAKAVAQYVKDNPNGQKCETTTQNTSTDSNSSSGTNSTTNRR
jgi:hypothetical protein